ncbi:MAG: SEC-C domain-containing protein [Pirellulales bacterium]
MRLHSDKVKLALLHPKQAVRQAAAWYFSMADSPDPEIMPLAIRAVQRHGFDDAFGNYMFMEGLAQSEQTIGWLLDELDRPIQPERRADFIVGMSWALEVADVRLLKPHSQRIGQLQSLEEGMAESIAERLRFADLEPAAVCQALDELIDRNRGNDSIPTLDYNIGRHIVEALARHADQVRDRALAWLNEDTGDGWPQALAVRLAGELRLEAAIPRIAELVLRCCQWRVEEEETLSKGSTCMNVWGWETVDEEGQRAFIRIGSDAVVDVLFRTAPAGPPGYRMFVADVLGSIHSDFSVCRCLDLLDRERDETVRAKLLRAVLGNFASEGIELARQYVLRLPFDETVLEVRRGLLEAALMIGQTFPEFDAWNEDSKNDKARIDQWCAEYSRELEEEEVLSGPCPCRSGMKFNECCYETISTMLEEDPDLLRTVMRLLWRSGATFPLGVVNKYGPDDKRTTQIVAGVILSADADPVLEWFVGTNVEQDPKVARKIAAFFESYGVTKIARPNRNLGCPHEEGPDYPEGEDCPFCPFWRGKQ